MMLAALGEMCGTLWSCAVEAIGTSISEIARHELKLCSGSRTLSHLAVMVLDAAAKLVPQSHHICICSLQEPCSFICSGLSNYCPLFCTLQPKSNNECLAQSVIQAGCRGNWPKRGLMLQTPNSCRRSRSGYGKLAQALWVGLCMLSSAPLSGRLLISVAKCGGYLEITRRIHHRVRAALFEVSSCSSPCLSHHLDGFPEAMHLQNGDE